jgi:hypothetical protein
MSRANYFKNSTPHIEDRLNKHSDHYSDYLAMVLRIHNAEVAYMEYPNRETAYELQLSVSALKKKCTVLFKDVSEIRQLITAEDKKKWADRTSELDRLKYIQVFKKEKNDNN